LKGLHSFQLTKEPIIFRS